jgi:ABC-type multidrug transport system ATPase subunit
VLSRRAGAVNGSMPSGPTTVPSPHPARNPPAGAVGTVLIRPFTPGTASVVTGVRVAPYVRAVPEEPVPPGGSVTPTEAVPASPVALAAERREGLVCEGLTVRYRRRPEPTIRDVGFVVPEGGLLAVVGPSGSGKSTLCTAILGEVEQVRGRVLLGGVDLLQARSVGRQLVSFVPQRDALHNELTPRGALALTAALRLAPKVGAAERARRVDEVLQLLEIGQHASTRIGQLSGGQRKRVAVAMELLSDPRLLMLDEPTAGLDEGLDRVMMLLLRRIADSGCAVMVVTHSTANLALADAVLALDSTGRVAYCGAPGGMLEAFAAGSHSEAMQALRVAAGQRRGRPEPTSPPGGLPTRRSLRNGSGPGGVRAPAPTPAAIPAATPAVTTAPTPAPSSGSLPTTEIRRRGWARVIPPVPEPSTPATRPMWRRPDLDGTPNGTLPNGTRVSGTRVNGRAPNGTAGRPVGGAAARTAVSVPVPGRVDLGVAHCIRVLVVREFRRMAATPFTVARGLLLLPLLTVLLTAWADDQGLSGWVNAPNRMQGAAMSVLITCITFFAMALSFSTVVGDRDVIDRENRWGVPPVAVVTAKALSLIGPVLVQMAVTLTVYLNVRKGPDHVIAGVPSWLVLGAALGLLGLASMCLGLLISAASRSLERAVFLLMGSIAVLVVLTGLLIPFGHPSGFGGHTLATVSQFAPTRWGTAAVAAYIGFVPIEVIDVGGRATSDPWWVQNTHDVVTALVSLTVLALIYGLAAAHLLARQSRRRR